MLEGKCQSDAADAARLCLLDLVEAPRGLPEALTVAPRPVRHITPASAQAGRDNRRKEDPDRHHASDLLSAQEASHSAIPRPRTTVSRLTPSAPLTRKHQPAQPYSHQRQGQKTGRQSPLCDSNQNGRSRAYPL
jgi:hypothetical protein